MKINIYTINRSKQDEFTNIVKNYQKRISKYAQIKDISIFNKKISKAQNIGKKHAKSAYTEAFLPYMKGYNIALDPHGKELNSLKFYKIFDITTKLNFFIAGAFGFEDAFLAKCDSVISLSQLTFGHKIAKVILYEQIYRSFSIKNNHPYHK